MITDNPIHPKVYEITKIMDTFPLGCQKITLAQSHYNEHTDICQSIDLTLDGIEDIDEAKMHYICDYYKSSLKPVKEENTPVEGVVWSLNKVNDKLYVAGQSQIICAVSNIDEPLNNCNWKLFINEHDKICELDDEYEDETMTFIKDYSENPDSYYLKEYLDISIDNDNHTFTIAAISKDIAPCKLKIEVCGDDNICNDFVEMEVII